MPSWVRTGLPFAVLAGAFELRSGIPAGASPDSSGPDIIGAMSTELFLDFIAIRMDGKTAAGLELTINLTTPDNGETFAIEVRNETMTNVEGFLHETPDLTLTINRTDLERIMMGRKTFIASIEDGTAKAEGDVDAISQIAATLTTFEIGFEVFPGTAPTRVASDLNRYEVPSESSSIRGE